MTRKWGVLVLALASFSLGQTASADAHIMMTRQARAKKTPVIEFMRSSTTLTHQLDYYGGNVLANVKIVGVFWGSNVETTVRSQIGDFYATLTNSPMIDFLSEYNTNKLPAINGHTTSNQTIGRGTYGGDYVITPKSNATTVDDSVVQAEITAQIAAGKLPPSDNNTLYMVHFSPNVTITMQGSTSCQDFCAYHSSIKNSTGSDTFYGIMPDFSTGACSLSAGGGCGTGSDFQNFTTAASHEVVEAITDSQIGDVTGNNIDYPAAWYSKNDNMEIGDICAFTSSGTVASAATKTIFTVQGEWSNAKNLCYTGN